MELELTTKSEKESIALGREVCEKALSEARVGTPLVFCLKGELGVGKTRFTKGMAEALGVYVSQSPTFAIMRKFSVRMPMGGKAKRGKELFFHIDCYRIQGVEDAKQIGLDRVLLNPKAVIVIEWAERIMEIIPKPYWEVKFEHIERNKRKVSIRLYP